MTQHSETPHRDADAAVVVGADGSPGSIAAVRWAARTAADRGRTLHIVHCTGPIIAGNTLAYGATSGRIHIRGGVGERAA
ncbi:universal stress protein, partial [Nocardioides sp. NPDC023903]|uniref:universal stress protein n=1 Tax=Nocardioides sp. NPDC023903 TaxID=3157195 RepID=UPI0033CDDB97